VTLLVLGAGGQVGRALCRLAAARGIPCRGLDRSALDITDRAAVAAAVAVAGLVVNAAAYTAVDQAEREPEAAYAANRDGVANLAEACAAAGRPLLQLSTDYVFDGERTAAYRESDAVNPLSVYGASKAAGEAALRQRLPAHLILRTAWVFAATGHNFVRTMLRLGRERREIRVVADQIGGPTAAADVAAAILTMAAAAAKPGFSAWGTFHFAGAPPTSWYGLAQAVLEGRSSARLAAIATADYPTPARRPLRAVLDCTRIAAAFGIAQPQWRQSLRQVLREIDQGAEVPGRVD